jgi:hypothetical protein
MPHQGSLGNAAWEHHVDPFLSDNMPYDEDMPDTYGKRQRENVKAKKAAAKEERRIARNQRREAQAAGVWIPPEQELVPGEPTPPNDEGARSEETAPEPTSP